MHSILNMVSHLPMNKQHFVCNYDHENFYYNQLEIKLLENNNNEILCPYCRKPLTNINKEVQTTHANII